MSGLIRPKMELDWAFMPVLVTSNFDDDSIKNEGASLSSLPASIKRIDQKATEKRWRHHYKSMEAFCCHGHQSFDPICLKTLCSLSPPPVMLHIRFDQDWPTGFRDIQVRKCKMFVIQRQVTPKLVVWSGVPVYLAPWTACPWGQANRG